MQSRMAARRPIRAGRAIPPECVVEDGAAAATAVGVESFLSGSGRTTAGCGVVPAGLAESKVAGGCSWSAGAPFASLRACPERSEGTGSPASGWVDAALMVSGGEFSGCGLDSRGSIKFIPDSLARSAVPGPRWDSWPYSRQGNNVRRYHRRHGACPRARDNPGSRRR